MPVKPLKMPTFHGNSSGRQKVSDAQMQGEDGRAELNRPENQRLMRQFMLNPEGEKNSSAYRAGWDRVFAQQKECPNGGTYKPGAFDLCRCEVCIEAEK